MIDDELAVEPLARLGWHVSIVSWRQTRVPWNHYDVVIIRSTWDYWDDVGGFLETLKAINSETMLANALELVRWNLEKTYLKDMEQSGVTIVPTLWPKMLERGAVAGFCQQLDTEELVIKPVLGANGVDTFRVQRSQGRVSMAELIPLFRKRPVMVQRFMPAILSEGEYSLFYFGGAFSHAILKVPAAGEFRSQEERGAAIIPVSPEQSLRKAGDRALATVDPLPLYARIDLVRDDESNFLVMELELIEPSLYLRTDPGAPARFAQAVNCWGQSLL